MPLCTEIKEEARGLLLCTSNHSTAGAKVKTRTLSSGKASLSQRLHLWTWAYPLHLIHYQELSVFSAISLLFSTPLYQYTSTARSSKLYHAAKPLSILSPHITVASHTYRSQIGLKNSSWFKFFDCANGPSTSLFTKYLGKSSCSTQLWLQLGALLWLWVINR